MTPLLSVEDLRVEFRTEHGIARAADQVSFFVRPGETLCLVGESGCGKSVTALSIMGLLPRANASATGRIVFDGRDMLALDPRRLAELRGDRLAMIFQEPMTSLNPAFTIASQLTEVLVRHRGMAAAAARAEALDMLRHVRIPAPEVRIDEFPHRLSGGMRQRVMIAMALLCRPALLIADEPTTALDVTIQAQVLNLMRALRTEMRTAILLITHDLGVVAEMADRVVVMYAGQVVEEGAVAELFAMPQHPYTVGLLGAVSSLDARRARLPAIEGMVPAATDTLAGCRFAPRCPFADDRCRSEAPSLVDVAAGHRSRCWRVPLERLAASLPASAGAVQ
ncbi:MAG TPA: ABC transporter ATP-binding protein [Burkholderiaceae bacterium]|nr:ABC transporter ATP-binding protein [Burkholderiaceae bacterium]